MKLSKMLLLVVAIGFVTAPAVCATEIEGRDLDELVAASDHIIVGLVVKVDMVDEDGNQLYRGEARTGPGIGNQIRLHIVIREGGVLKTNAQKVPDKLVIPLWEAWHFSLGQKKKSSEGKEFVFLLQGKNFEWVYPSSFQRVMTEKDYIIQMMKEVQRKEHLFRGKKLSDWVAQLNKMRKRKRSEAARVLGMMGIKSTVPALIALLLRDKDPDVRNAAVKALSRIRDETAAPVFAKVLVEDGNAQVRANAVMALEYMLGASAAPEFMRAAADKDATVRACAVYALREVKDASALPYIINALSDNEKEVCLHALYALRKIKDKSAIPALINVFNKYPRLAAHVAETLGILKADEAVPALINLLNDKDWSIVNKAIIALGEIGDAKALPELIKFLESGNENLVRSSIEALGRIKDRSVVPVLLKILESDKSVYVLASVVRALGEINDISTIPKITEMLSHSNHEVKLNAANALGIMDAKQSIPALMKALQNDNQADIRPEVLYALFRMGETKSMIDALSDKYPDIRYSAADILGRHKVKEAISALITVLSDDEECFVRMEAARALGEMHDRSSIPALIKALDDKEKPVQVFAVLALNKIFGRDVYPDPAEWRKWWEANKDRILKEIEKEKAEKKSKEKQEADKKMPERLELSDPKVREKVVLLLGEIGDKSAVPFLLKRLGEQDPSVRFCAAEALEDIGEKFELYDITSNIINDYGSESCLKAVKTLIGIGSPSVVPQLCTALHFKAANPVIRDLAYDALKNITGEDFGLDNAKWREWWEKDKIVVWKEVVPGLFEYGWLDKDGTFYPLLNKAEAMFFNYKCFTSLPSPIIPYKQKDSIDYLDYAKKLGKTLDEVRTDQISKLEKIDNEIAIESLINQLWTYDANDNKEDPSARAVDALVNKGEKIFYRIKKALKGNKLNPRRENIRAGILDVLNKLGPKSKKLTPVLIELLNETKGNVRNKTIETLRHITGQDINDDAAKWQEWWEANKDRILKQEAEKENAEKDKGGK